MGMYDEILCECELPVKFDPDEIFQTKDFDCALDLYKITADGRLLHQQSELEIVPEEERPYYGKKEWDENPIFQMFGALKRKLLGWKDTNFHGIFRFYTYKYSENEFYEFEAKFTDGNLNYIKLIDKEPL